MTTIPNAAMTTLGVYVQVPFCASKCSFCNFSSGVERSTVFDQYTRMLQRELEGWPDSFAARGISPEILALPVDSIYMGGGTPALLGEERWSWSFAACTIICAGAGNRVHPGNHSRVGRPDSAGRLARHGGEPAEHRRANF